MTGYRRHSDPVYIAHSLRLKLKSSLMRITRGFSPLPKIKEIQEVTAKEIDLSYGESYHSLSYFKYAQAEQYYYDSNALISKVIVALCYYNDFGMDDTFSSFVSDVRSQLSEEVDCLTYRYPKGYDKFAMKAGSISGIIQAKLASLFLRAKRPDDARRCLNACLLSQEQKGPYRQISSGMSWVEEYPSDSLTMVLNGHVFNLIALVEYAAVTKDCRFDVLFDTCLTATLSFLPNYWHGEDMLYSMHNWDFCNVHYMGIMTYQMEHLFKLTRIQAFKDNADRIRSRCTWPIFKKMIG